MAEGKPKPEQPNSFRKSLRMPKRRQKQLQEVLAQKENDHWSLPVLHAKLEKADDELFKAIAEAARPVLPSERVDGGFGPELSTTWQRFFALRLGRAVRFVDLATESKVCEICGLDRPPFHFRNSKTRLCKDCEKFKDTSVHASSGGRGG